MGCARRPRCACSNRHPLPRAILKSLLVAALLSPSPSLGFGQVSISLSHSGQNLQETDVQRKATRSHTEPRGATGAQLKQRSPSAAEGRACWDCHLWPGSCSSQTGYGALFQNFPLQAAVTRTPRPPWLRGAQVYPCPHSSLTGRFGKPAAGRGLASDSLRT